MLAKLKAWDTNLCRPESLFRVPRLRGFTEADSSAVRGTWASDLNLKGEIHIGHPGFNCGFSNSEKRMKKGRIRGKSGIPLGCGL